MIAYRLHQCSNGLKERKIGIITFFLVVLTSIDLVLFMRLVKQMHNYTFLLSQLIYPLGFTLVTWFISLIFYRDRICCLAGSKRCKRKSQYQNVNKLDSVVHKGNDTTVIHLDDNSTNLDELKLPRRTTINIEVAVGPKDIHDHDDDEDSAQEYQDIIEDENKYHEENPAPSQRFSIRQHWVIMLTFAVFDTLSGTMAILPILYLPSIVILLFGQLTLPLNLLLSKLVLHYQFQRTHYYGAIVVFLGVIVASYADSYNSSVKFDNRMLVFWALLLLVVKLIDAGTIIYRERMLKKHNLKAWHTTVWVSLFQTILSLLLLPVILIPFPKPWVPISVHEFEPYVRNAFHCIFGQPLELNVSNVTMGVGSPNSNINLCVDDNNLVLFAFFLIINIAVNVLSLQLTKLKSSNYAITMAVLRIGISAFLFTQEWLAGVAYHAIMFLHVIGFFVIVLGILVYSSQPVPSVAEESKQQVPPMTDTQRKLIEKRKRMDSQQPLKPILLVDDDEEEELKM